MAQKYWHIGNCSLFQRLSSEQLNLLERRARQRSFPKNSAIYLPTDAADGAYLLADGRIRLSSVTPDGKQAILGFIEPGELFGELGLVETGDREERAEAIVESVVVHLPGDILQELMEQSAALTLGVTKLIGFRRRRVERRLRSLLFRSNRDRLAYLLIELVEQYGRKTSEGVLIEIKLSHQDLASIIGATRETVTVLLGELQLEGLLRVSRQKVVVRDVPRLAAGVQASVPELKTKEAATKALVRPLRTSGKDTAGAAET